MEYQATESMPLKTVRIYDAKSNTYTPVLFDESKKVVIGFDPRRPYIPVGGQQALDEIVNGSGLVPGCTLYGFPCRGCYDDVVLLDEPPRLSA